MKTIKFLAIVIFLFVFQTNYSQKKESKLHFYGGFGLSFYNNSFQLNIQPGLIYDVSDIFKTGAGVQYAHGNSGQSYSGRSYSYNVLGFNVLQLAYPVKEVELSAEFEDLYVMYNYNDVKLKYWSPALFAGAGYRYQNFAVGFRFNFLHKQGESIYNDAFIPYVRIYF